MLMNFYFFTLSHVFDINWGVELDHEILNRYDIFEKDLEEEVEEQELGDIPTSLGMRSPQQDDLPPLPTFTRGLTKAERHNKMIFPLYQRLLGVL